MRTSNHCTALCTKIGFILSVFILLSSCDAVKRVPDGSKMLTKNNVIVDSTEVNDLALQSIIVQQSNSKILGVPLGIYIYNLARPNRDSIYYKWATENPEQLERRKKLLSEKQTVKLANNLVNFNQWLRKTGQAPTIINDKATASSQERLRRYYWNRGYFNTVVDAQINDNENEKRAAVSYYINRKDPYFIDSLKIQIPSKAVDSLYKMSNALSYVKKGDQYQTLNIISEQDRLFNEFRNQGVYDLKKEYIKFEGDTVNTNNKANLILKISDHIIPQADTTTTIPLKIYTISEVNIRADIHKPILGKTIDTTLFRDYNVIQYGRGAYRKQTLTDAIVFKKGDVYRDLDRDATYRNVANLNSFQTPTISYREDPRDSTNTSLIADIKLYSKEKYELKLGTEATHNNIQTFGIGGNVSVLIRNIFRGSELLNISLRTNLGTSANPVNEDAQFFDLREFGADATLNFPRLFVPFDTKKIIPKYMSPFSQLSAGFFSQTNIGLDKQSFNASLNYNWRQTLQKSTRFDLINVQYVRNLDPGNFFNVYRSSYGTLNDVANNIGLTNPIYVNENNDLSIPEGSNFFITDVNSGIITTTPEQRQLVRNIGERRDRLIQDNLIISSSYRWTLNTSKGVFDNNFSKLSLSIEAAGNTLDALAKLSGIEKNEDGFRNVFGVTYTQYIKPEVDYVKRWQLNNEHVIAMHAFGGIAIPYGNSDNIPFNRSYFAGGPNDNRAWQAYELGPGGTGGVNDFNEANMKLTLSAEYRFPILGSFKGALFADVGNIFNVLDSEQNPLAQFNEFTDFEYLAVGTGAGIRYDFGFFVLRLDAGLKTYNPALEEGSRWFTDFKLNKAVLNVGINYPF